MKQTLKQKNKEASMIIGYLIMYFIFTTILYFILRLLNKIPENWNYVHIMFITLLIVIIGKSIKWLLK